MTVRRAAVFWDGPAEDAVWLLMDPGPELWERVVLTDRVALLQALDEYEQPTGDLAGIEVGGFLGFDAWDSLPDLPIRWQVGNDPPRSLEELLPIVQVGLLAQQAGSP
ncbi:MAG: hypothetical protein U0556_11440 [Dehalococcoidia bacterium]